MIPMIVDSKLALDQHRDPRRRPDIGVVAVGEGSLNQQLHQTPALGLSQFSAGVLAKSGPAKRRVPLAAVPGATAARNWQRNGSDAPLRSETNPYPTRPTLVVGDPPANRHCPSVGAYCSLLEASLLHSLCRCQISYASFVTMMQPADLRNLDRTELWWLNYPLFRRVLAQ
jgi:hypothetical protein